MDRVNIAVSKEVAAQIDEVAKAVHFTSRGNVVAMLVRNFLEESK